MRRTGQSVRFKSRLVARGFRQVWGEDYLDTFSPVMKVASMRSIVALAAYYGLNLTQSDISTAFVQAPVEEEDYIKLPELCKTTVGGKQYKYARLNKALYGLKQAPRAFNMYLTDWLKEYGFQQLENDECVFTYESKGKVLLVGAYVDDLLIASNDPELEAKFKAEASEKFSITHQDGVDDTRYDTSFKICVEPWWMVASY